MVMHRRTKKALQKMLGCLDQMERSVNRIRDKVDVLEDLFISEEESISQKELSATIGISVKSLIKWRREGLIPHFKTGPQHYYIKSAVIKSLKLHAPAKYSLLIDRNH